MRLDNSEGISVLLFSNFQIYSSNWINYVRIVTELGCNDLSIV